MGEWRTLVLQIIRAHKTVGAGGNKKKHQAFLFPLDNPSLWAI
jgi:hypothetical protein